MTAKKQLEAQNPLILRSQRLIDVFAKSNDERDFYLDRQEGFIVYVDLDKPEKELETLDEELKENNYRYVMIPKLTFYETKKIMEGFVNEKVYDIDTKEKLLDIIQSREARENFLEFIQDHHSELEKWQQFYQERSRIRIIEWLRINNFHFVFEEDLDLNKSLVEKLKTHLFQSKAPKDVVAARKGLFIKAKTYYSNEALNPRPKRGRPPKQVAKLEIEPQISCDIYTTVPPAITPFLFTRESHSHPALAFSSKFETDEDILASRKSLSLDVDSSLETLNQKLEALKSLSNRWLHHDEPMNGQKANVVQENWDDDDDSDDEDEDEDGVKKSKTKKASSKKAPAKSASKLSAKAGAKAPAKKAPVAKKEAVSAKKATVAIPKKAPAKAALKKSAPIKVAAKKIPTKK